MQTKEKSRKAFTPSIIFTLVIPISLFYAPFHEGGYGLYIFLRLMIFAYSCYLIFVASTTEPPQLFLIIVYLAIAALFQPFWIWGISRDTWVWLDILTGILFLSHSLRKIIGKIESKPVDVKRAYKYSNLTFPRPWMSNLDNFGNLSKPLDIKLSEDTLKKIQYDRLPQIHATQIQSPVVQISIAHDSFIGLGYPDPEENYKHLKGKTNYLLMFSGLDGKNYVTSLVHISGDYLYDFIVWLETGVGSRWKNSRMF